jgi:hypothetical protein
MGVLGEESRAYIVVDAPYALEDAKDGLVSILTEGRFHYTVLVSPWLRIAIPMMDILV